jgi:Tfp pilus assembly protein PilF
MKSRASAIEAARAAGDTRRLVHHLESGIMVDPTQSEWHLERARIAKESGDLAKAVEAAGCASAALQPGKERTAAFVFEAECLVAAGDPKTALLRIEKALSETPDDAAARGLKERLSAAGDPPK